MNKFPNFPLYSSLKKDEFKELTNEQKDDLLEFTKNMNEDQQEKVYALIRSYHLDEDVNIQDIPYNGRLLKTGLKFDIDCLPSKLQCILHSFSILK